MKKIVFIFFFLLSIFIFKLPVRAQNQEIQVIQEEAPPAESEMQTQTVTQNSSDQASFSMGQNGPHFFAGERMSLNDNYIGDVYVAGEEVTINGNITGDLLVAASTVTINGEITGDLRALAGDTYLNGTVGDDISLAGNKVYLSQDSSVKGSVMLACASANLEGSVGGNVLVGAEALKIAGLIQGNVRAGTEELTITDETTIYGYLTANYTKSQSIAPQARIMGEKNIEQTVAEKSEKVIKTDKAYTYGFMVGKFIWSSLTLYVLACVLLYLFSPHFSQLATQINNKFLASLGVGFAYLLVAPVTTFIILVTALGSRIAILHFLVYLLLLNVARFPAAFFLGKKFFALLKKEKVNQYLMLLVGVLLYRLIMVIPKVGWIAAFVVFLAGLGSILQYFVSRVAQNQKVMKK